MCVAVKRLYVEEPIFPAVVEALGAIAERVKVGPGSAAESELGPLNNRAQFDRVSELVDDARGHGKDRRRR